MKKNTDKEKNVDDLLEILRDIIIVLGTTLITLNLIRLGLIIKAGFQHDDSETASLKEGNILKTEIITKDYKSTQKHKIKKVVIDTNNNGIEDADDVVIDGKLFTFSEVKEGRKVVFLQSKKKLKPLAVENKNGKFDIKKTPSETYNLIEVEKLDNEFNNIIAQKSR